MMNTNLELIMGDQKLNILQTIIPRDINFLGFA